jgi:hypothetical protein
VLVVDDEACIRTFAERALAEARHGVVVDWKLECRTKSVPSPSLPLQACSSPPLARIGGPARSGLS